MVVYIPEGCLIIAQRLNVGYRPSPEGPAEIPPIGRVAQTPERGRPRPQQRSNMLFPSNFDTTFGSTISLFFHLWLWATRPILVNRLFGTKLASDGSPNVETLGYFRRSLWEGCCARFLLC